MLCSLNGALISVESIVDNSELERSSESLGLIETMLYKDGCMPLWFYHFQRLSNSIQTINSTYPSPNEEQLLQWSYDLIRENAIPSSCILRIEWFFKDNQSFFLIETRSLSQDIISNNHKKRIGIASSVVLIQTPYSSLKTTSRQLYKEAKQEADKNNWYDALLINENNKIVESTISNIFWIKNSNIYTPPCSEGCVDGVYRTFLFQQMGNHIQEQVTNFCRYLT